MKNSQFYFTTTDYHDKIIPCEMQLFSRGGENMKISRLVISAVSLAVSAALLTLSIIDLIQSDEY